MVLVIDKMASGLLKTSHRLDGCSMCQFEGETGRSFSHLPGEAYLLLLLLALLFLLLVLLLLAAPLCQVSRQLILPTSSPIVFANFLANVLCKLRIAGSAAACTSAASVNHQRPSAVSKHAWTSTSSVRVPDLNRQSELSEHAWASRAS